MADHEWSRWIRVHDGMPDHPKIEGLSDRAFRLLIEIWCWCSRHLTDGEVPEHVWAKRGTARARAELLDAGLLVTNRSQPLSTVTSLRCHDYLEWQRSSDEVRQLSETKSRAGRLGNHRRWHEVTGRYDPACEYCKDPAPPSQTASHVRSHPDRTTDRKSIAEKRREEKDLLTSTSNAPVSNARATELAATAHTVAAHRLVTDYAASCNRRPPTKILTQLAVETDALLAEGWPAPDLARALTAWGAKGLGPGAFQAVAHEVVNRRTPATPSALSTTDQRVADAQALKAQFRGGPSGPPRALPGGGSA